MVNALVVVTLIFICINLIYFFRNQTYRQSYFSTALFFKLFIVMTSVLVGFGVLYYLLSLKDVVLITSLSSRKPIAPDFLDLLYFSGETLFSVGYGDMLPIGVTRLFALLESMIGILLPTAYFMKALDVSKNQQNQPIRSQGEDEE